MPGAYVSAKILGGGCMEEASAVQVPKGLLEGGVAGSMGGLSGWPRRDVAGLEAGRRGGETMRR